MHDDNEVLQSLDYDPERGGLFYRGVRYLLIRPETLRGLGEMLAEGGRTGGKLSGLHFKQALGLDDEQAVQFMCRMGGQLGWGAMRLVELDPAAGRLVVEVAGSPFAEAGGPCHLIRGVFAGLAEGLFGGQVVGEETACAACGDSLCRFETRACASA